MEDRSSLLGYTCQFRGKSEVSSVQDYVADDYFKTLTGFTESWLYL